MTAKNTETKTADKTEVAKAEIQVEPKVRVKYTADSWRRKRGEVKEVPAKTAEKLIRNGHATPVK